MGLPVLVLGESGSGKSASLRNFNPDEVVVFNVAAKRLPFRSKLHKVFSVTKDGRRINYKDIEAGLRAGMSKTYVIDDSQYLMAFELFDKAKVKGYDKFTDIAVEFKQLIDCVTRETDDDTIVYFLHHVDESDGKIKAKTVGKMLDSQLTLEGLFSIVFYCTIIKGEHVFITQSDGNTTAKSPMEMFDIRIDNDLKAVDAAIRKYYEMGGQSND